MPSHQLHLRLEKLLLGRSYLRVSQALDSPYRILGRAHRKANHDLLTIAYYYLRDPRQGLAAWLHIMLDSDFELCRVLSSLRWPRS